MPEQRINGKVVLKEPYIVDPTLELKTVTKTDNYTVTVNDTGKLLVMNNGSAKAFTLPSVTASDVGLVFGFASIGAGQLTINAADSDLIDDSSAGGSISATTAAGVVVSIVLELVSATQWAIRSANGTWTTA